VSPDEWADKVAEYRAFYHAYMDARDALVKSEVMQTYVDRYNEWIRADDASPLDMRTRDHVDSLRPRGEPAGPVLDLLLYEWGAPF